MNLTTQCGIQILMKSKGAFLMNIVTLSDSETTRNTYDKDVGYLMRILNSSDSESARNTYDKGIDSPPE